MSSAAAQSDPFLGQLTTAEREELARWGDHYWNRVEHGTTLQPGVFNFTNTAMNHVLFNPVRGVRATLEALGVVSTSACDGLADLNPGMGDEPVRKAFKDAMRRMDLATHTANNPAGTAVHFNLLAGNPGATWVIDNQVLISTGLPWEPITTPPQTPTAPGSLSAATQEAIAKLLDTAPAIAAASAGVSIAESLLTGQQSHADRFERGIRTMLDDGGWNAPTWRVDAAFAVFGSLPLVGVTFDDAYVLLDTVNGALAGPFSLESPLNAQTALAEHPAAAGLAARNFDARGCPVTFAKQWRPNPPPPAAPSTLVPLPLPAGGTEPFKCKAAPGGGYKCERLFLPPGTVAPPGSPAPTVLPGLALVPAPTVPARQICTTPAGCEPVGYPGNTAPADCGVPKVPGGNECPTVGPPPGPPSNPCAPTCRIEYWY